MGSFYPGWGLSRKEKRIALSNEDVRRIRCSESGRKEVKESKKHEEMEGHRFWCSEELFGPEKKAVQGGFCERREGGLRVMSRLSSIKAQRSRPFGRRREKSIGRQNEGD